MGSSTENDASPPGRVLHADALVGYRFFDGSLHEHLTTSLRDVIASLTDNQDLRAVMCYGMGRPRSNSPDAKLPFRSSRPVVWAHFFNCAYYPEHDGPQSIVEKIVPALNECERDSSRERSGPKRL
uniref:Uncharacterized protein n=1 Tax=Odontella aurita TaxID=265563 RepID=A0A7S4JBJ9_9STRA